jgi:hypothetical protein
MTEAFKLYRCVGGPLNGGALRVPEGATGFHFYGSIAPSEDAFVKYEIQRLGGVAEAVLVPVGQTIAETAEILEEDKWFGEFMFWSTYYAD